MARIQHATEIVPKGVYELDEETNQLKMADELPPLSVTDLNTLENWAHLPKCVLDVGRCSLYKRPGMTEEE